MLIGIKVITFLDKFIHQFFLMLYTYPVSTCIIINKLQAE